MSNQKELLGVKAKRVTVGEAVLLGVAKQTVEAGMSKFFRLNSSWLSSGIKVGIGSVVSYFGGKANGYLGAGLNTLGNGFVLDGVEDGIVSGKRMITAKLSDSGMLNEGEMII
jgi:hypothetical protein